MALFTRLREKVVGSGLKFDNIDNIAKKEDEVAHHDNEKDNAFMARHSKSNVSVFTKEKQFKSFNEQDPSKYSNKINDKFANVVPMGNNENAAPQVNSRPSETGPGLSKKLSFHTLNSQMQKEEPTAPQLSPRFDALGPDNRFATSRSVSFRGAAPVAPPAAVPSIHIGVSKSESKEEEFEDVHAYSDDDVDEHELSKQDRIEMVFSKARHNHADEVIAAIQNGFNANTRDNNGNTIMHICAQNNRKKLAATLLQKFPQCNIRAENQKNLTPLDYAEKYGFAGMATWLKEVSTQNEAQTARNVSKFR